MSDQNTVKRLSAILLPFACACLWAILPTAIAAEASTQSASELAGRWLWDFTMPDGTTTTPRLRLRIEGENLTGTTNYRPESDAPVTNLVFDGTRLRFQVIRQRDGQNIVTTYSGTVTSNAITGKIESNWAGETETFDWNALRANIGVEGIWRWTNAFPVAPRGGRGPAAANRGGPPAGSTNTTAQANRGAARGGRGAAAAPALRGGGGGGRRGGTRVELFQESEFVTGRGLGGLPAASVITNGAFTNGVLYFEIANPTNALTIFRGKQIGDTILGTIERKAPEGINTIEWEATREE